MRVLQVLLPLQKVLLCCLLRALVGRADHGMGTWHPAELAAGRWHWLDSAIAFHRELCSHIRQ